MPSKVITESIYNSLEESCKAFGQYMIITHRANIIKLSYIHSVSKISKIFGIARSTIYSWIKSFAEYGIEGLKNNPKHHGGLIIKDKHKKFIKTILSNNPNITIKEVKITLEKEFDISVSKSIIHLSMRSTGHSYITSRKIHYKQDKAKLNEFKKNSYPK